MCEPNRVNLVTDVIIAGPIRHLQYTSFGLTVEPESHVHLGVKLVNLEEGQKCTIRVALKYGRFPAWTSTTYDEVEFINDGNGNYHHTGWIECTQVDHLLQHLAYYPNIFDARQG